MRPSVAHAAAVLAWLAVAATAVALLEARRCGGGGGEAPPPPPAAHAALPMLHDTRASRLAHDEWHTYVRRVYGDDVRGTVDLNAFEWLYNFAPLHLLPQRPIAARTRNDGHRARPGTLYYCASDDICGQYRPHGYFVTPAAAAAPRPPEGQEVLHHSCEWEDDSDEVWFYALRGSGVFLRPDVRTRVGYARPGAVLELVADARALSTWRTPDGRRALRCDLFASGWAHNATCDCDPTAFLVGCRTPPVALRRRTLRGDYLC
jgi:hypothetical protein